MEDYLISSRLNRYRGIFADPPRKEALYNGLLNHSKKLNRNGPVIRASRSFIATTGRGPDGGFSVFPIEKPGEIVASEPVVKGHTDMITDLAFNPFHEPIMASASKDKAIHIWKIPRKGLTSDVTDPRSSLEGHSAAVNVIKYHPTTDCLLASASSDNSVRLWDVSTGTHPLYPTILLSLTVLTSSYR
jgi:coronin-1B/1C/6